ncbi:hypothetical protein B0H13DRAFT_2329443 [Mycena leptocephala]|nr:hypothetical protein B0H13DRAFT_2329443 [Mycena leptocephala]
MPSYMASISSPASKSILLRAYFSRSLAYWISRGRPILNIRSFFTSSMVPMILGPTPTPYSSAFPKPTAPGALTPNPWLQIIQSALVHPDDHLGKFQHMLQTSNPVDVHPPDDTLDLATRAPSIASAENPNDDDAVRDPLSLRQSTFVPYEP